MNHFAKTVEFLRNERGLNQSELSRILECSRTTICNWETGRSFPNYLDLVELADFFNVNPSAFFENKLINPANSDLLSLKQIKENAKEIINILEKF